MLLTFLIPFILSYIYYVYVIKGRSDDGQGIIIIAITLVLAAVGIGYLTLALFALLPWSGFIYLMAPIG
jgi:hypothetical protein